MDLPSGESSRTSLTMTMIPEAPDRQQPAFFLRPDPRRDMPGAFAAERFAGPGLPAVLRLEAGDPGHQVQLGRPDVAERYRPEGAAAVRDADVVGAHPLGGDVVAVERPVGPVGAERHHCLPGREL